MEQWRVVHVPDNIGAEWLVEGGRPYVAFYLSIKAEAIAVCDALNGIPFNQELQNRAERLSKIFKPRLEGSIYTQDTDREVLAFLVDAAMLKFKS